LTLRVTPRAKADAIIGWRCAARDELDVRVRAAPEDGKANAAVIKMLARSLGIPKSAIELVRGHTSRTKVVAFKIRVDEYEHWCDSLPTRP
jgi:uncharacterized protein (TIGR00251 family)